MSDDPKILNITWPANSGNWLVFDLRDQSDISLHVGEEEPEFRDQGNRSGPVDARIGLLREQAVEIRDFLNRVLPP